jgi:hypothetical protein
MEDDGDDVESDDDMEEDGRIGWNELDLSKVSSSSSSSSPSPSPSLCLSVCFV